MEEPTITPDWQRIEADYRAGLLSLRAIAAKDGHVTEGAIRKKARKLEWARDLAARIRAKAEELVRTELVRSAGPQYATASEATETTIVQDNAQILAHVELTQRRDISKARQIVVALFAELESVTGERFKLLRGPPLVRLASSGDEDNAANRAAGALSKATSLPARAATVKALADALRTLVTLEREAWGMDDGQATPVNPGRVIDSSKLSWEQRQQLRSICEAALARESR
ncbi:MAG: hypothetical protein WBE92_05400 [Steroidobacteraceae bacterium]